MTHPHPSCSCLIVCHRWAHADAPLHSATKPCQYMLSPIARASGIAHIPDFQSKLGNNLGNSDRVSWSAAPTLLYNSPRGRLRSGRSVGPARPLQRPLGDPDRGVDRSGKGPGSRPGRIGRSGGWR